jgi:hypothetical protein
MHGLPTLCSEEDAAADAELPQGILDTRPLFRLMSRSLDGLVEMARGVCTSSRHRLCSA